MVAQIALLNASSCSVAVTRLLLTNSPPTLEEEFEIRRYIQAATIELAELDLQPEEKEDLQADHGHASSRFQWTQFIQDHQVILSPVRRLPPEILGEIFLYAATRILLSSSRRGYVGTAWTIARVSSLWRAVALGLPALWADIVLESTYWRGTPRDLQEILRRSRDAPLKMSCSISPNGDIELLELILTETKRWHVASLGIPPDHINRLRAVKNHIPLLEVFTLERNSQGPDVFIKGDWLGNAPRLRSLSIKKYNFHRSRFAVPWSQLTSFHHTPCVQLEEELGRLYKLSRLASYRVSKHDSIALNDHPLAVLGNLRQLILPERFSLAVLAFLHTPKLESIDWHVRIGSSNPSSSTVAFLRLMLWQAPKTLRHITIEVEDRTRNTYPLDPNVWANIVLLLRDWQNPDTLDIGLQIQSTPMMVETFLLGLVLGTGDGIPLLPELRSLNLWFEGGRTHSPELSSETQNVIERLFNVLKEVLESRMQHTFSLKLATSRFSEPMWKAWNQRVQRLQRDFTTISLTSDSPFRPRP